ncbi:MAG: phosphoglycerate mutase family protein [Eubacteriales bacterium]
MKVALIRHLKVNLEKTPFFMSSAQFDKWNGDYDKAPIIKGDIDLSGIRFDKYYCSDMPRAIETAAHITDNFVISPELHEVPIFPFVKTKRIKLPFTIWRVFGRLAWLFHAKSQTEIKILSEERATKFLNKVLPNLKSNVAIITHGFFILGLAKHLKSLGFSGPRYKSFKNGEMTIYTLEE